MARYAFLALPYPVWSIVYLNTAYQSLSQINEMLHTFVLYSTGGVGRRKKEKNGEVFFFVPTGHQPYASSI